MEIGAQVAGNFAGGKTAELLYGKEPDYGKLAMEAYSEIGTKTNEAITPFITQSIDALTLQASKASATLQPMNKNYFDAIDEVRLMLGMTVPKQGSFAVQQRDLKITELQHQIDTTSRDIMAQGPIAGNKNLSEQERTIANQTIAANMGKLQNLQTQLGAVKNNIDLKNLPALEALQNQRAQIAQQLGSISYHPNAALMEQYGGGTGKYSAMMAPEINKLNQSKGLQSQLQDIDAQIAKLSSGTGDPGTMQYTPEQVIEKLESTPGYQFNYDQGIKAIQRNAAKGGSLISGNTMLAAQKFGQEHAQNTYQTYLGNLMGIANSSQPGVLGQANIMNQLGQNQANVYGTFGQLIGQQTAQALRDKASLLGTMSQSGTGMQAEGGLFNAF